MSTTPIKSTDSHSTDSLDWSAIQTKIRKHLIWKEGRFLLPACIGLLSLVLIGMVAGGLAPEKTLAGNASIFIALTLGGAAMAALVCGSITFSMERENQTDDFLSRLPLSGTKLNRIKIATATIYFVSSYLIAVAMSVGLFAIFFGGQNLLNQVGSKAVLGSFAPLAFLIPGLCFLGSMMFSRYLKSTLNTVICAVFFAVLFPLCAFEAIVATANILGMPARLNDWLFYALFLTQIVLMVYAIGRRPESWLRPSSVVDSGSVEGAVAAPFQVANTKTSYVSSTRSLLWQTFRFKWLGGLIALLACGLYLAVMLSTLTILLLEGGAESGSLVIEVANDFFAAALGGVAGLFLFSKDHAGGSFRFFQQRADYPRRIWLARFTSLVAVGLVVICAIWIVNLVMHSTLVAFWQTYRVAESLAANVNVDLDNPMQSLGLPYLAWLTLRSATMFFVVAAAGQIVSIFCRHGIVNALLGIGFCTMAAIWVRYVNWCQSPVWSLAWPIGIAAFTLSWAYAPSWIRGTRQFRWSFVSILAMTVVSVACIFGLRRDRLNDYPVQPAFADLDELYEHPEKLEANGDPRFEVARKITAAVSKIDLAWSNIIEQGEGSQKIANEPREFTAAELQLVKDQQGSFETIAKLIQDPATRYYFYKSPDAAEKNRARKHETIESCLRLYKVAAKKSGDRERIQAALFAELAYTVNNRSFYYPKPLADMLDWVDADLRTSEEILPLIDQIESLIRSDLSPDNSAWLENAYFLVREELEPYKNDEVPWEFERMKRQQQYELLKTWNQEQQFRLKRVGAVNMIPPLASGTSTRIHRTKAPMRDDLDLDYRYSINFAQEASTLRWLRYAQVRMALAAWRCDHQGYPKKLDELRSDYLMSGNVPRAFGTDDLGVLDHLLQTSFSYHPEGLDLPVVLSADLFRQQASGTAEQVTSVIPANTPFLLPWQALPTEQRYFQIKIPEEQTTSNYLLTDPELGYFMGKPRTKAYGWTSFNSYPEFYILGPKKSEARDSDE